METIAKYLVKILLKKLTVGFWKKFVKVSLFLIINSSWKEKFNLFLFKFPLKKTTYIFLHDNHQKFKEETGVISIMKAMPNS